MDRWGGEAATFYLRHGPSSKEKPKSKYQMDLVDDIKDIKDEFSEAQMFYYQYKVSSDQNFVG